MKMSSPLMRLKLAAASGSRDFRAAAEVGSEKRPALEGLRAGGRGNLVHSDAVEHFLDVWAEVESYGVVWVGGLAHAAGSLRWLVELGYAVPLGDDVFELGEEVVGCADEVAVVDVEGDDEVV